MITIPKEHREVTFLGEVIAETPGGERLVHCMQCGSCGGSCPNGADMDHTPRRLLAMIAAGEREKVLSSNTMWNCLSCYACTTRCPQNIPVTDIMYTLKRMSLRAGTAQTHAPAMARAFTFWLDTYGRSYEVGLAIGYYTFNRPMALLKMGPMGLSMFAKGRMSVMPTKIRQVGQLRAIIQKAKELGGVA